MNTDELTRDEVTARTRWCEWCEGAFLARVSKNPERTQRFCTESCRLAAQRRRYYLRHRDEEGS